MPRDNWHTHVFFGLHYDLHARATDTELGRELTHEHLRERLLRVKPDWIQCDCKGHAGHTSWPTQIGSPSPGIITDALRIHRDVTRELGIKLGMHYSGVWDTRAIELHPDWALIHADSSADPNFTCRLSGYVDELMIPQMLEVVEKYDVDGFWVDGENWASRPCWCERCQAEFRRRTGLQTVPRAAGDEHWSAWLAFHRDLFTEHVTRYTEAVHARKPDCLICSNWMYTMRQPEAVAAPVDYLSGDYSPWWGADRAAVEGRVMDGRGMTWDLMAWGFTRIGGGDMSPWVMKTPVHLCQELSEVIALGGAVMVYNQPQRSGWLTGWHQELLGDVAEWCRERQEVCFRTETAAEVAILHLAGHYYTRNDPLFNLGSAHEPVEGALHAILENQLSADIMLEHDATARIGRYKLVIVPGQTRLSEPIKSALLEHARAGGAVLLSGGHLAAESADLVGVELTGLRSGPIAGTCGGGPGGAGRWLVAAGAGAARHGGMDAPDAPAGAGEGCDGAACEHRAPRRRGLGCRRPRTALQQLLPGPLPAAAPIHPRPDRPASAALGGHGRGARLARGDPAAAGWPSACEPDQPGSGRDALAVARHRRTVAADRECHVAHPLPRVAEVGCPPAGR